MVLSGGLVSIVQLDDPRASLPPAVAETEPPAFDLAAPISRSSAAFADPNYDQAVADLEQILETGRSRLDAETVRILEDNLRAIDQAIDQSRKALRSDPNSVYLNNHFAASRNRKLALLRRASALAMAPASSGGS
jgi:tetratricopeptide (TPR) repeat protein